MNKTLERKKAQARKLLGEIHEIETTIISEKEYPKAKELEGTYSKAQNGFGGSGKFWWVYRYVRKVKPDGTMLVDRFETDEHGSVTFTSDKTFWRGHSCTEWIPISKEEYLAAKVEVLIKVSCLGITT